MPRLESPELRRLEQEGASAVVSETVQDMADAYMAYLKSIKKQSGSKRRISRGVRNRLVADLQRRFGKAD